MGAPGSVDFCLNGHAFAWRLSGDVETYGEYPVQTHDSILHTCPCGAWRWGELVQYGGIIEDELGLFSLRGFDELHWEVLVVETFDLQGHPLVVSRSVEMRIPRYSLPGISWDEYEELRLLMLRARAL